MELPFLHTFHLASTARHVCRRKPPAAMAILLHSPSYGHLRHCLYSLSSFSFTPRTLRLHLVSSSSSPLARFLSTVAIVSAQVSASPCGIPTAAELLAPSKEEEEKEEEEEEEWPSPEAVAAASPPVKEPTPKPSPMRRILNKLPRLKKRSVGGPETLAETLWRENLAGGENQGKTRKETLIETLKELGLSDLLIVDFLEAQAGEYTVGQTALATARLIRVAKVGCDEALTILLQRPSLFCAPEETMMEHARFLLDLGLRKSDLAAVLLEQPGLLERELHDMHEITQYLLIIGIASEQIPVILTKRPELLMQEPQVVKYIIGCLVEANVPPKELSMILRSHKDCPELFSPRSQQNIGPVVCFLKKLGVEGEALGKGIARKGKIINFSLESMESTYKYLQKFMTPDDATKLACRYAGTLVLDPDLNILPIIRYLSSLGVKPQGIKKVLLRCPQLLRFTVQSIEPNIQYLRELGVKEHMLGKVITMTPQVLTLKREGKMERVIEFLRSIGLEDAADIERLLSRNALLLCFSVENNIVPKINYFLSIGMLKKDVLRILVASPCLFSLNVETNIVPKVNYFVSLGLSREDVVKIMVAYPSMFSQSIDRSLNVKYRYLIDIMGRSNSEIISFPQYFGYSLEKRIKPRHEKLSARGHHISLASMLVCTDVAFHQRYVKRKE